MVVASAVTAVFAGGCDSDKAYDLYEKAFYLGLPKPMTEQADVIYDTWLGSVAAALAVGVFVWGLIFYAVIRYRKNSDELPRQVRYNLPIEVLYTVVPFVIISGKSAGSSGAFTSRQVRQRSDPNAFSDFSAACWQ